MITKGWYKFPVEVLIKVDGIELKVCSAAINRTLKCSVKIDDSDEDEKDTNHKNRKKHHKSGP